MQACPMFEAEVRFSTASLSAICACCNKDTDTQFAPTVSQLVLLSTKYFIIKKHHHVQKSLAIL